MKEKGFTPLEMKSLTGFTLIELVIGSGVLLMSILGVIAVYNHSILLNRVSEERILAFESARGKLEEMRNHSFATLQADYGPGGTPGNTFTPTGLTGMGSVQFFDQGNPALGVRVIVCWREKGRLFGEDQDLDGQFDAGEDANGNGRLNSPVELVTYF